MLRFVFVAVTGAASCACLLRTMALARADASRPLTALEQSNVLGGNNCTIEMQHLCEGAPPTCENGGCKNNPQDPDLDKICQVSPGLVTHFNWWYECIGGQPMGGYSCSNAVLVPCNIVEPCGPNCDPDMSGGWECPPDDSGEPYPDDNHNETRKQGSGCGLP
jgi:hypothetical protein